MRHPVAGTPKEDALQVLAVTHVDPQGEPEGLEKVFLEHQGRVFRAAYRITGNAQDAEDVLQTVFLRLARRGDRAVSVANQASYLYRSAINAALDVLRMRQDRTQVPLEEAEAEAEASVGSAPPPERIQEAAEMRLWLRRALARLTPHAAEMFALRYLEDQDNKDIARMLGVSRVRVAVTLHRARHRLQREFRAMKRGRT